MNTSFLSDEKFIQFIKTNLQIWKEEGKQSSDKRVAWDWIKYKVCFFGCNTQKSLLEQSEIKRKVYRRTNSKPLRYNFNKILAKNLIIFWINIKLSEKNFTKRKLMD